MPSRAISEQVDRRLEELYERHRRVALGDVATFCEPGRGYCEIDLTTATHDQFAIAAATTDGDLQSIGDDDLPFALQSVSKVFVYGLALEDHGRDHVLQRVGVEPSGDAFNSIVFDERHNRPYNPMINAGALVISNLVRGADSSEKLHRILGRLRDYAGSERLEVDAQTFERELHSADHNRATAYLMCSQGMIDGDVEATLALYLSAVKVTCRELALMGATLANGGTNPVTDRNCLPRHRVRDVLSVMYTCGMYDFDGQWAYETACPPRAGSAAQSSA